MRMRQIRLEVDLDDYTLPTEKYVRFSVQATSVCTQPLEGRLRGVIQVELTIGRAWIQTHENDYELLLANVPTRIMKPLEDILEALAIEQARAIPETRWSYYATTE